MPDLLIELLSEEIPARMQPRACADLRRLVTDGLVAAGLTYAHAGAYATPRRLTLAVEGLTARSPDRVEERRGPKVGAPEAAVAGFARGARVAVASMEPRETGKGPVWFARIAHPGRDAPAIVAEVLEAAIRAFPWPKSMRWGTGSLRWVRPLHRILCLLSDEGGAQVVPLDVDGIVAGDVTEGHRFMSPGAFSVVSFEDYAAKLKRAHVILSTEERADIVRNDAANLAFAAGLEVVADDALLTEIAGLVEWPVTLMGRIDARFLDLPPEVLQTSMREHQKFLSVREPVSGGITGFVTVANRETVDDGATILAGNQRVLAARLADAAFFWENDLRVATGARMQPWIDALANVTFHNRLGSQRDRVDRIAALAREIAPAVGADPDLAEEAARIAKADLTSQMVYEFPDLQGIIGRHYALAAGFPPEVADAARDHWKPLGPSDAVPSAPVTVAVALADKIDTLTGFWAIDEKPTGSKDPYALRRAGLGVIRLILSNAVRTSIDRFADVQLLRHQIGAVVDPTSRAALERVLDAAAAEGVFGAPARAEVARLEGAQAPDWLGSIRDHDPRVSDDLRGFLHDRLKVFLRDEGLRHDVIDACIAMPGNCDFTLLVSRAEALAAFLKSDDGANLLQLFRRTDNILSQAEAQDGVVYEFGADAKFADADEERALFAALDATVAPIATAMDAEDFAAAMAALAALRPPLDAFFEAVQVNDSRQVIRRNRLNLLSRIRTLCLSIADLRRIEG